MGIMPELWMLLAIILEAFNSDLGPMCESDHHERTDAARPQKRAQKPWTEGSLESEALHRSFHVANGSSLQSDMDTQTRHKSRGNNR